MNHTNRTITVTLADDDGKVSVIECLCDFTTDKDHEVEYNSIHVREAELVAFEKYKYPIDMNKIGSLAYSNLCKLVYEALRIDDVINSIEDKNIEKENK